MLCLLGAQLVAYSPSAESGRTVLEPVPAGQFYGWRTLGEPGPAEPKRLWLALTQRDAAELAAAATHVSTPSHPRYGQHLSLAAVNALIAPPETAVNAVLKWLEEAGVPSANITMSVARDFMVVNTNVHTAEALLNATFIRYGTMNDSTGFTASPSGCAPHSNRISPTMRPHGALSSPVLSCRRFSAHRPSSAQCLTSSVVSRGRSLAPAASRNPCAAALCTNRMDVQSRIRLQSVRILEAGAPLDGESGRRHHPRVATPALRHR